MQNPVSVSIVLPCYNPCEGWSHSVVDYSNQLTGQLPGHNLQFIVSNDGSSRICPTEIAALQQVPSIKFVDNPINQGKGSAIRKGIANAEGDIIIYTDIDFPFGVQPVVDMIRLFAEKEEYQFIYGKRVGAYFTQLPLKRRIISKAIRVFNQVLICRKVTDTQAGIKGLRREIADEVLTTKTNTFVFEIELMRKLIRKGIGIHFIDVAPEERIVFSDFSSKTLFKESINLAKIILATTWPSVQ